MLSLFIKIWISYSTISICFLIQPERVLGFGGTRIKSLAYPGDLSPAQAGVSSTLSPFYKIDNINTAFVLYGSNGALAATGSFDTSVKQRPALA